MIFALTEGCNLGRADDALVPVFIGLTVAAIICLIAPLTQVGLKPGGELYFSDVFAGQRLLLKAP